MHYAWIVVIVTTFTLIVSSGMRSAPTLLIRPFELEFGWTRDQISLAIAVGLFLFGFSGPFAGKIMDRFGARLLMLFGIGVAAFAAAASTLITEYWELVMLWGVLSGIATGAASAVLGATVSTRWFNARRGLVSGIFGASLSGGQLIFIPALQQLISNVGWHTTVIVLGAIGFAALLPIVLWMRDDPDQVGLEPYGGRAIAPPPTAVAAAGESAIMRALRTPEFWLLAGSFFICGATSNGLIGTHFIPHSLDHGIPEAMAAGTLALMGSMNFVGTVTSGWLTDRYDPRKLLACYYFFRGMSLFILPFVTDPAGLGIFAIIYGLDWIATVPPTQALCASVFGRANVGMVFGWVFFSHQVGGSLIAYLGGWSRVAFGDYTAAFLLSGGLAVAAAVMSILISANAVPRRAVATA